MTRRKKTKYSSKIATFICDNLEKGINVAEMCRKYPEQMPEYSTVFKWRRERPEFKSMYDTSYQTFVYRLLDELNTVSTLSLAELYPHMDDFKERSEARRARIDALKFQIAKIAPKVVTELQDKQTIEHKGADQIAIISYAVPDEDFEEKSDDKLLN